MKKHILTFLAILAFSSCNEMQHEKPEIYSLRVESMIKNRYAQTKVTSLIANKANVSQEVFFTMTLPEDAFITSFVIEMAGKEYKAYLKEKDEAKKEYQSAVMSGNTAAHIEQSKRDSNIFTISVNVEESGKVKFVLNYEELLKRSLGVYSHAINLNPRQVVRDLQVDVYIYEPMNITNLFVPEIRTTNEIQDNELENQIVKIKEQPGQAHIQYKPTLADQEKLSEHEYGGQLVVEYDIDRNGTGGNQILVNDGYFVHFFSPNDRKPLTKYAIFVLDVSGSMYGKKIEQMKQAMVTILDDLKPEDYFNIMDFSYSVTVHNLDVPAHSSVISPANSLYGGNNNNEKYPIPEAYPASQGNIEKAKNIINKMIADGGTNIYDALSTSVLMAKSGLAGIKKDINMTDSVIQPIIMFLTDGDPTVGETSHKSIINMVQEFNSPKAAIFSLGFGRGADMEFLRKISLSNSAFARTIYADADASKQLNNFYKEISSPLLSNVTFAYIPGQVKNGSLTKEFFPTLFLGSEIIVAGKVETDDFKPSVVALTSDGKENFSADVKKDFLPEEIDIDELTIDGRSKPKKKDKKPKNNLERIWVYITIKNLIDQHDSLDDANTTQKSNIEKSIIDLAMKYQFVTPFTSLIVVKPNQTTEASLTNTNDKPGSAQYAGGTLQGAPLGLQALPSFPSFPGSSSFSLRPMTFGAASTRNGIGIFKMHDSLMIPHLSLNAASGHKPSPFSGIQTTPLSSISLGSPDISTQFDDKMSMVDLNQGNNQSESVNLTLYDMEWFNSTFIQENSTLTLPVNNSTQEYKVSLNYDGTDFQDCSVEGESGKCRHIIECIREEIISSIDNYMKYFCPISGGFAGVCCNQTIT